ncbi:MULTISPECIES: F0F1 ATP synthase subunit epsilon [Phyllobacteriaceae]|uniref:ATP synthase epsilon chain n=1 Tax=Phyllobacterium phragmitis TaxID=2670329 RepID=A0ABQ0H335_9HYPH|nr:F0F1 ATP synthase subunit epsilon [Mesorhizobium sp. RMAD-H1]MBB2973434.1 F-type H+-transporting ATPase subunit epsilon [Mesorhizobium sp. RMAD-H1]
MAEAFHFELVSPERLLLSAEVTEVVIPGSEGYLTVMARHAPLMSTIKPGVIRVRQSEGKEESYVVFGGFADISPEGCTILAESAVHVDDLNREELQRRIQDAREDLADASTHEQRTKAEQFLHQLMTLEGSILPA